ncbi:MAG: HEAT repeat domain-containing protein, partial [Ktedonobacteraceae bacterium]
MEHEELHQDSEGLISEQDTGNILPERDTDGEAGNVSPEIMLSKLQAQFGLGHAALARETAIEVVRDALNNADWQIRAAAVRRFGEIGGQEEVGLLVTRLEEDESTEVRAAAARALSTTQATVPEAPLMAALKEEEDNVREAAVLALGSLDTRLSQFAIDTLEGMFYGEPDEHTRATIVSVLGRLDERTPLEVLHIAFHDAAWLVRETSVLAMGRQKERADIAALEAMLDDEVPPVCEATVHALNQVVTETRQLYEPPPAKKDEPPRRRSDTWRTTTTPGDTILFPADTSDVPQTPSAKKTMVGTSGNVSFKQLEPSDIENFYPVVAQAFDDQWAPDRLLRAMFAGKTTYQAIEPYLAYLVRTEYIRSLVTSEKLIINRVFMYNNAALYRDILPGQPGREAFKGLLDQGVIVPFLFNETSPVDVPAWISKVNEGFSAWSQVCQEVQTHCLRFSWDSEQNQEEAKNQLALRFQEFAANAEYRDPEKFIHDLQLDPGQVRALRNQLGNVADRSRQYFRENDRHVVRTFLYEQFVTTGPPALRQYDGSKPFAGAIKRLIDLAYNSNLADSLGGHLLTPADSPTRLVLQEWESLMKESKPIDAHQLITMLRRDTFQLLQQTLAQHYLKSMGLLSLGDVQEVRKTDEWLQYIAAQHQLLKEPLRFNELAGDVSSKYIALMQRMTALLKKQNEHVGGTLTAPWEPAVEVTVHVGGEKLSVIWHAGEVSCNVPAGKDEIAEMVKRVQTRSRGDALCDIRLTITDGQRAAAGNRADLATSIEVMKGKMSDAQSQFE